MTCHNQLKELYRTCLVLTAMAESSFIRHNASRTRQRIGPSLLLLLALPIFHLRWVVPLLSPVVPTTPSMTTSSQNHIEITATGVAPKVIVKETDERSEPLGASAVRITISAAEANTATYADETESTATLPTGETSNVSTAEASVTTLAGVLKTDRQSKPIWVWHPGIPKTASSFLQCALCGFKSYTNDDILFKDNWYYIGVCPNAGCRPDPVLYARKPRFKDMERDGAAMQLAEKNGYHVYYLNEDTWRTPPGKIQRLVEQQLGGYDVWAIITYRPLYSWLLSWYNQKYKRMPNNDHWPGELDKDNFTVLEAKPFDLDNRYEKHKGQPTPSFSEFVYDYEVVYKKHPAHITYDSYKMHINNTHILPSHQAPQLEYIFCNILPNSPHICEEIKAGRLRVPTGINTSSNLDIDILAVAAWRAGLIPKDYRRANAHNNIIKRLEELQTRGYKLPLQCLPQEKLDRLERLSLFVEHRLFNSTWTAEQEEQHHKGFMEAVEESKFCNVNTTAVLEDPDWRDFFQT